MKNIFRTSLLIGIFLHFGSALASEMPPTTTTPHQDETIWKEYCGSVPRNSTQIPIPNYASSKVQSIVKKLTMISPFSYYFYSGPMYAYNLKVGKEQVNVPANFPDVPEIHNGKKNAHAFLTILCGEFRDRPSLIEAKINWVRKMYTMPITPQKPINPKLDLWPQVSAQSYKSFIANSRAIFSAKQTFLRKTNQSALIGNTKKAKYDEDQPVEPFSVCETKFIFKRYVEQNAMFGGAMDFDEWGKTNALESTGRSIASTADPNDGMSDAQSACVAGGGTLDFCMSSPAPGVASMPIMPPGPTVDEGDEFEDSDEDVVQAKQTAKQMAKPLQVYLKAYAKFAGIGNQNKNKRQCADNDVDYFYDFRGDSNFKPNSPESNGMIWYSSSITSACLRKDGKFILKDKAKERFAADPDICEKYFKEPFKYRWSAARAGLATWIMHDKTYDDHFAESGDNVTVYPHLDPMNKPFGFKMVEQDQPLYPFYSTLDKNQQGQVIGWDDDGKEKVLEGAELAEAMKGEEQAIADYAKYKAEWEAKQANKPKDEVLYNWMPKFAENHPEFWKRKDLGFSEIAGFYKDSKFQDKELAFERLRDSVNRHTDWYASAYDDGSGTLRDQAYSPFVASSYEMSASDGFTSPGVTVSSPADGCKHWMFVFKLKKDQWYNTQSIRSKTPIDFNRHWFDETSLGTNGLADSERALDRLGTALEGEMDSILYIHNITTSGKVDNKCGTAAIVQTFLTPQVAVVPQPTVTPSIQPAVMPQ
jgi:hypothetical protein